MSLAALLYLSSFSVVSLGSHCATLSLTAYVATLLLDTLSLSLTRALTFSLRLIALCSVPSRVPARATSACSASSQR